MFNPCLGGQWVRTRSGWRLSESEDSEEPSRQEVQDVLGAHIKRESNKYLMERASGINGAPRKSRLKLKSIYMIKTSFTSGTIRELGLLANYITNNARIWLYYTWRGRVRLSI